MQTIKTGEGQTLVDIAMQYLGDASRVFEIADMNGMLVTDQPAPGTEILIPDAAVEQEYVANSFEKKGLVPASAEQVVSEDGEEVLDEGIDFWAIEDDFEVTPGP